jgi:transposase
MLEQVWAGIDAGKTHHHCVVIDADGKRLLSRRVTNDETALLELIADVCGLAPKVSWGIDLTCNGAALVLTLFADHAQEVFYISGRNVNSAAGGYRGEGKTDAKDAFVIADQARMRRDLVALRAEDELIIELRMLVTRRRDLSNDRTRTVNRLREQLLGICPALERALDVTNVGPLVLLTGYQTPAAIRKLGVKRLATWLRARRVRGAQALAERVVEAAVSQTTRLPGEKLAADLVKRTAEEVIALNQQLKETDALIEGRFRQHADAELLVSMPGIGTLLGTEFLAATGGDMSMFASADHLAGYAGLAPAPRDSGRVSGNLHRPKRYNRALNRVFYTSALVSVHSCHASRIFYDRKRAEGKRHVQAVLALARRRVNVVWALLRDRRPYQAVPPLRVSAA